jgi:hypothetical protein
MYFFQTPLATQVGPAGLIAQVRSIILFLFLFFWAGFSPTGMGWDEPSRPSSVTGPSQ